MKREHLITSETQLREHYEQPVEGAILKQKDCLNDLSKQFIESAPFLCLATANPNGSNDCSPKGDPPGFVKILDDQTIAIPDRKGNNRLDSLVNILNDPKVGIIFMIPGRYETLRINGRAQISNDPELLAQMVHNERKPTTAVIVDIDEVYFHCPKALIRSKLWQSELKDQDLQSYAKIAGNVWNMELSDQDIAKNAKEYKASLKDKLY